jgi:hypothetical protein
MDDVPRYAVRIIDMLPKDDPQLAVDILVYTLACTIVATDYTSTSVIKGLRAYVRRCRSNTTDLPDGDWLQ